MKNNLILIESSKEYAFHVDKVIERSKREIFSWFLQPTVDCRVKAFIYKDIPSLVEGLKKRGFNYPEYMCACMIDEDQSRNIERSINIFEPQRETLSGYTKKEYDQIIYHELIHYITNYLYGKLPEWITEGIAKYLDGTYKDDLTNLMNKYINIYEIPDIKEMKDMSFVKKVGEKVIYDGYDLSYIMIRYIIENYGHKFLLQLLEDNNYLKFDSQNCLLEAISYFNSIYNVEKNQKNHKI